MWWKGPSWLANPQKWPPNIVTQPSPEGRGELKIQRELFAGAVEVRDDIQFILGKFDLSKVMRIWVSWFMHNGVHPIVIFAIRPDIRKKSGRILDVLLLIKNSNCEDNSNIMHKII
jgi:hypothetical protein